MIQKTRIEMNGNKYDRYVGSHWELRDMLKVGDLVTLRRQNAFNTESIEIVGTVSSFSNDNVFVLVDGVESIHRLVSLSWPRVHEFMVMLIRRPVKNMLPDHAGLWRDKDGNIWALDDSLGAIRITLNGHWNFSGFCAIKDEKFAPFTELTITDKENDDER